LSAAKAAVLVNTLQNTADNNSIFLFTTMIPYPNTNQCNYVFTLLTVKRIKNENKSWPKIFIYA